MGLLSGSISLNHYQVLGDTDKCDNLDWIAQRLSQFGFRPIDQTAEELSCGWVRLSDSQDADFAASPDFSRENYLAFSLRIDRRRVPGALLKQHFEQASEEFLQTRPGMKRVPKSKREELRDQVRLSLLARTLPTPATYDILWDRQRNRILLLSLNRQAVESFETLFGKTFEGMRLSALTPMDRALAAVDDETRAKLKALDQATSDGYLEQIEANRWLGWDFLRWLFHNSLTTSSEYPVNQEGIAVTGAPFVAYLNDRLLLAASSDEGQQKVTLAGPQTLFAEARTALAQGKELLEAIIYLERDQNQWRFSLKGDRFHFGSMRCPVVKPEVDPAEVEDLAEMSEFFARVGAIEEAAQLFDSLLARFVQDRMAEDWSRRQQTIQDWLQGTDPA